MARFILSRSMVFRQFRRISEHVDLVAYSYKTNPEVWRVLKEEAASMVGLSSMGSAVKVRELNRAMFYVQGESEEEISWLLRSGVRYFIVDNEPELERLLRVLEREDMEAEMFLRMKMKEHTIYTGKHFVYGMNWRRINEILPELRSHPHVRALGIHFHRKTQNVGEWSLVKDLQDALSERSFEVLDMINVGGGIPVRYANTRPEVGMILNRIGELRDFLRSRGIRLMAEPGRFIAAPSVALESSVLNVYENVAVLDCSIFNAYMDTYLLNIRLPVLGEVEEGKGRRYLLKGRSPDSLDIFRYSVYLKRKLRPGDIVTFLNAGAYNFHSEFNDLPKIGTVIVDEFPFDFPDELIL